MNLRRRLRLGVFALLILPAINLARGEPCSRLPAGSDVSSPPDLYSADGKLTADLSYQKRTDAAGRTLYCFTTADGGESPTFHLHPGDRLVLRVKNDLPTPAPAAAMHMETNASNTCGSAMMTDASVNIHYHGTNTPPTCHADEVIRTLINPGETFTYDVPFPPDEPPGLYWYHPHVHGTSEAAVQGGASGAIVVEGIERLQPSVRGVPQRLLIVRDEEVAGSPKPGGAVPAWDLTLNYVPIAWPKLTPAIIRSDRGGLEFWRVLNAAADTILDLEVDYDGAPQTLWLAGIDGVPVGSQDGAHPGTPIPVRHFKLPPGSRAEFLIRMPAANVRSAQLRTLKVNTGPEGDNDPARVIATIVAGSDGGRIASQDGPIAEEPARFAGLEAARVTATRRIYFSEVETEEDESRESGKGQEETQFFITVDGQRPKLFSPDNPPSIVTKQGAVEDWIIENRSQENHVFHIHQIHFQVLKQDHFEVNGSQPVPALEGQLVDTIDIPFWDGNPAHPYPTVRLRMDFRGTNTGDFPYHCHILEHEDKGMMATIRVLPGPSLTSRRPKSRVVR
jgi:FtsP/CotA-like multicopper oxidase with cupredoxin domain